jgi:hypothetical protein
LAPYVSALALGATVIKVAPASPAMDEAVNNNRKRLKGPLLDGPRRHLVRAASDYLVRVTTSESDGPEVRAPAWRRSDGSWVPPLCPG